MSSEEELRQNALALSEEPDNSRTKKVLARALEMNSTLCSGCGYCSGCPIGIPISDYMLAYNSSFFPMQEYMGRSLSFNNDNLKKAYSILRTLRQDSGIIPETVENPCIKCGQCEAKCTQHLPIMSNLEEIFRLANVFNYSQDHIYKRVDSAFATALSGRVGIYPAGVYSDAFYLFFKKKFSNKSITVFDKNPSLWGKAFADLIIENPKNISKTVDVLLITHYLYQDAIFEELLPLEEEGVRIIKLHDVDTIPYFC